MSRFRITIAALSLGLMAAAANADEGAWSVAPSHAAAAQLGRPVAAQTASADVPAPAALLERPRGLSNPPTTDPQVRPASFDPVFRAQAPDAKPLPPAGATSEAIAGPRNWQRFAPDQAVPAPTPVPECGAAAADCDACHGPLWTLFHHDWFGCKGEASACCGAAACDRGCCDPTGCDGGCCDFNRFYVSAEYLRWSTKGGFTPVLVTQGSLADLTSGARVGAIDLPGTAPLFGGTDLNSGGRSGARFMVGWWCGDEHAFGIEGGGFWLADKSANFTATSTGVPILTRPFFDTFTGLQQAELVAAPGILAGTINVRARNSLWGAEANLRSNLWCGPHWNVDLIGGYRYIGMDDSLAINESLQAIQVPVTIGVNDTFTTQNRFNGGQIGLDAEWKRNRWSVDFKTKVALGDVSERVNIIGTTVTNGVAAPGGLLAQPTNMGAHSRNRFAWSPELGVNLGYQVTDHVRAFVGYDFLYLSDVVRAGDQVDFRVDSRQLLHTGGGPNPAFIFHGTDFWAQGVSLGLEFKY